MGLIVWNWYRRCGTRLCEEERRSNLSVHKHSVIQDTGCFVPRSDVLLHHSLFSCSLSSTRDQQIQIGILQIKALADIKIS